MDPDESQVRSTGVRDCRDAVWVVRYQMLWRVRG